MPNVSKIRGFQAQTNRVAGSYTGQDTLYAVAAADGTALFVGDPVVLDGSGSVDGIATVTKATASGPVLGVISGIFPAKMDPVTGKMTAGSIALDTPQYRVASTAAYVLVQDDPSMIYEAEAVTGANASYTYLVADIGLNVGMTTVTGNSSAALDMSTKATTATLPWKIVGVVQRPDNEAFTGVSTAVKLLVKINAATMGNGTGSTGQ